MAHHSMSSVRVSALAGVLTAAGCGGGSSAPSEVPVGPEVPPVTPPAPPSVALAPAFSNLRFDFPVLVLQAPGDDSRWFVVEKGGRVMVFPNDEATSAASICIDISDRVESAPGEAGLLGLAFDPQAPGNAYLSYTGPGAPLISFVSRFTSPDGGSTLDPNSEQQLLIVDQPFENHNGGYVTFGPDGLLYVGLGDGGSGGDPLRNGQSTNTLLGTLLRLDVRGAAPYEIPPDNPFATAGGRPEIYAFGLRNPWRFSFDRLTGELWAGDVGQGAWEEVDLIRPGGNYGWNIMEGNHCFNATSCDSTGLIAPLAEYSHDEGCSITGGFVYRGSAIPELQGMFVYGDFCTGRMWGLSTADRGAAGPILLVESGLPISSFGEGNDGEIYVVEFAPGAGLHRLVRTAPTGAAAIP